MKIDNVWAVYFSPTGTTGRVVAEAAKVMAGGRGVPLRTLDFTLPDDRRNTAGFTKTDLVIFGTPVYAGRVPNKILPEIQRIFEGGGALAVPVVTFGNRSYDNALIELRNELESRGFHTVAGGAFVAEHAFSEKLAEGRPDEADLRTIRAFARDTAAKIAAMGKIPRPIPVRGTEPIPPYYQPLGTDGRPAVFLKAKPKITEECTKCGKCVHVCPVGSITCDDGWEVKGVCIKCQACVKTCPAGAIYFDDPAFLSHVAMLELTFSRKAENEIFL